MKTVKHDDMFANLQQFLQTRGIHLKEGSYTHRLQQGCGLLTDLVNTTNRTVSRACAEVDRKMKDIRETLRRRKSPKGSAAPTPEPPAAAAPSSTPPSPPRSTKTTPTTAKRGAKRPAKTKVTAKTKRPRRTTKRD